MLSLLSDENIPYVKAAFGHVGSVRLRAGREMTMERVQEADVLLVRSVTRVDERLLAGSNVRFVGSATIGIDHIDLEYLEREGITFAHAPGSNADSVVEYVLAALLRLSVRRGESLRGKTAGIVGCGNVGGRLAARLPALGVHVLRNDPPLAEVTGKREDFVSLRTVLGESDLVSLHVPLTTTGPHSTHHLIDDDALASLRPKGGLVNTARGSVVDNEALDRALDQGHVGVAVLDVWENEPFPNPDLMRRVDLGTPHIAGYSFDGKVQGTIMLYRALVDFLGMEPAWDPEALLAPTTEDQLRLQAPDASLSETEWLDALVQQMYPIEADDGLFRPLADLPREERGARFTALRKHYPRRRTFRRFEIAREDVPQRYRTAVTEGLGVQAV